MRVSAGENPVFCYRITTSGLTQLFGADMVEATVGSNQINGAATNLTHDIWIVLNTVSEPVLNKFSSLLPRTQLAAGTVVSFTSS